MTFYSPSSGQVFLQSPQYTTTTAPGVFFAAPHLGGALCPAPVPSSSPLTPYSWLGRYGLCFNRCASVVFGILLIACGCASLAGATMALNYFAQFYHFGVGYWCGAMFVTAGGLAISAGHHRKDSLIVATSVTSGLTVALGIVQVTLAAFSLSHDIRGWECPIWKCDSYEQPPFDCHCYSWEHGAVVASSLLVGSGALAVIIGFLLFTFCLRTICGKQSEKHLTATAQYIPVLSQQLQADTGTLRKTISIPVQVQCTPTAISIEPSPKEDPLLLQSTLGRNFVQENL